MNSYRCQDLISIFVDLIAQREQLKLEIRLYTDYDYIIGGKIEHMSIEFCQMAWNS